MNKPIQSAEYKNSPQDFIVKEHIHFADQLTGNGEHLWLYIEKIGVNTSHLIDLLAKAVQIESYDIGYSGIKDRHAVTYQWVSLRLPKITDIAVIENLLNQSLNTNEKIHILKHSWHNKKLNRGTHKNNHFIITLHNVLGNKNDIELALQTLQKIGFPNYFGEQRFGNDGNNIDKAQKHCKALLKSKRRKLTQKDTFMISVIKSHLFNQILDKRVAQNTWHTPIAGDVFMLDGTHSLFVSELTDEIGERVASGDLHPTAPLFGVADKLVATDQALLIENIVLNQEYNQTLTKLLLALKVRGDRRALRVVPQALAWDWQENAQNNRIILSFSLPAGTFATALLHHLTVHLKNKANTQIS